MDIESHIEVIVAGIASTAVNIVVAEELVHETEDYHTAHRNSHLYYSAFRNSSKQEPLVLTEYRVQSLCAYFGHSSYRMPSLWGPLNDMQCKFV